MTRPQSGKLVLALLSALTLVVLALSIWKMLGTLMQSPAPIGAPAVSSPPAAVAKERPVAATPLAGVFPGRVGTIIDVSKNPDFADLPGAKVSLDLSDTPVADALPAFEQATGLFGVSDHDGMAVNRNIPSLTMHLKDAPLMEAVLQLCARTNANIADFTPGRLKLGPSVPSMGVGRWCVAGPFALSLLRMETTGELDPRGAQPRTAVLRATVFTDPAVQIASFGKTPTIATADDAQGKPIGTLASVSLERPTNTVVDLMQFQATWNLAPDHAAAIAHLRGTIDLSVAAGIETFQHDLDGAEAFTQVMHGVKFVLSPMEASGDRYRVELHVTRGDGDAAYFQQVLATLDGVGPRMLLDDRPQRPANAGISRLGPDERNMKYLITTQRGGSPPLRFSLDIPGQVHQVRVPFEFTDLPLR